MSFSEASALFASERRRVRFRTVKRKTHYACLLFLKDFQQLKTTGLQIAEV